MFKKLLALSALILVQSSFASSSTAHISYFDDSRPLPVGQTAYFHSQHTSITTNATGAPQTATVCFYLSACVPVEKETKVCRSFAVPVGGQVRQDENLELQYLGRYPRNCELRARTETVGADVSTSYDLKYFMVR